MNKVQKAVVIVIAVILCAGVTYTVFGSDDGEKPRFDEINLLPPDEVQEMSATEAWDGLKSRADTLVGEASDGNLSVNAMSMYVEDMRLFYEDTQTSYMLFCWEYNRDPSGLSEEYSMWETYYSQSLEIMNDAFREVLNGPGADTLRRVIGDGLADSVLAGESMTDEELRLIEAEAEAQDRYFNADPSDVETIAGIYGELIDIRGSLADLKGYDSYSEYAYEVQYGRGYSPEDTGAYKEVVKEALVPLYQILDDRVGVPLYSYSGEDELFADGGEFIRGVCPEFAELYDTMLGYGLIDFEDLDTKIDSGFCFSQTLSDGRDFLYIYDDPYGDFFDLTALVHEFGHASAAALSWEQTNDKDVGEVQSTGLEAIFGVYCGMMGGSTAIPEYMALQLLYMVIEGCFWDDFQQIAYEEGADTSEEFDAIIERLSQEYGYIPGNGWYVISHNFDSPFYYISYSVSAFISMGIFVDALDDYDAAVDKYLDVVASPDGYLDMIENLGMASPFDREEAMTVAEDLGEWIAITLAA